MAKTFQLQQSAPDALATLHAAASEPSFMDEVMEFAENGVPWPIIMQAIFTLAPLIATAVQTKNWVPVIEALISELTPKT